MEIGGLRPTTDQSEQVTVPTAVAHFAEVAVKVAWPVCEGACVTRISPGHAGFYVEAGDQVYTARGVILATGQYDGPCRLGVPGEDLPHVRYYFDRGAHYQGRSVAVVGGSFSALETAHSLVSAGAHVTLIHRGIELGAANRIELRSLLYDWAQQGRLRLLLCTRIESVVQGGLVVITPGEQRETLQADPVFVQIGYYADPGLLNQAGITYTSDGLPEHNRANGATAVPMLYIVGAATNGQIKGDRIGIKSGIPQAKQAVYDFTYQRGCAERMTARFPFL